MQRLNHITIKHGFTTHAVPFEAMASYTPLTQAPRIDDLVLAEVLSIGKHTTIEGRTGAAMNIFPGDWIMGAFGNRYATDQFEGYVPEQPIEVCDMLSVGGVCGQVASAHKSMRTPTRLRVLDGVCDDQGQLINQRSFGLPLRQSRPHGELILVVGASMNSGKTTTVGALIRALRQAGQCVAAAKVTGTAASKDCRFFMSCGANPVLDFTDTGYPSTYMLSLDELRSIYVTLLTHLRAAAPDYTVIEVADGIFQRETRMLLESDFLRTTVDHVFFAAGDSLAAECGVRYLRANDWPLRATSGVITQIPLAVREEEAVTKTPCLSIDQILSGEALNLMKMGLALDWGNTTFVKQVA
ncbi:MAG: hypothetical protein MI924_30250 [Chloroflexales bacterium]|nr:hypothetical protein [Chloroflexales bacterium]